MCSKKILRYLLIKNHQNNLLFSSVMNLDVVCLSLIHLCIASERFKDVRAKIFYLIDFF